MTPKEKAKEIFNSFEDDLLECDTYFLEAAKKKCALISVNYLINTEFQTVIKLLETIKQNKIKLILSLNQDYWIEVKKELELM